VYEWDREKDAANRLKHGIGFERAEDFDWPGAMIEEDERYDYGERRFRAFSYLDDRPFCVVFAPRGGMFELSACVPCIRRRRDAMASTKPKGPPPADYDPAAPLTDEEIKRLRPAREVFTELGIPMPVPRKRGRPPQEETKVRVTMRLDADIVDFFKSQGPGWQTRINQALAEKVAKGR